MSQWDQLEIVSKTGAISFYDLEPNKGTTNIGGHPDNDIVLEGTEIAPFHAVLDHRQRPYQLMALDSDRQILLDDNPLATHQSVPLANWGAVKLDGYTLILLERAGANVAAPLEPTAKPTKKPPAAAKSAAPGGAPPPLNAPAIAMSAAGRATTPFPDSTDDFIVMDVAASEATVEVEQTATFIASITNGGPRVATFSFAVEGIDPEWVTILPEQINLNDGQRATVQVLITPPRHPNSRAGVHQLAVIATSVNYPDHKAQRGVRLTIEPYHEFTVGELEPRQQTVKGRRPEGRSLLHILNKGNADATFRLEAMDDERACQFEFEVKEGQKVARQARQAEMRLPPEETFGIPVIILPLKRPLIGLRSRNHTFTTTVSLLTGEQTPRSLLGYIRVRPLIGPLPLFLILAALIALIIFIFKPGIKGFDADAYEINAGDQVLLTWETTRFTSLWITGSDGTYQRLDTHTGQHPVQPKDDATYTLYAENFLSMIPFLAVRPVPLTIDVSPLEPRIIYFRAVPPSIPHGDATTLYWDVANAETITIEGPRGLETLDPAARSHQDTPLEPGQAQYTLRVGRTGGAFDEQSTSVIVSAKPLPEPRIFDFFVTPLRIFEGETVTVTWRVEDATSVQLLENGIPTSAGYAPDTPLVVRRPTGQKQIEYQLLALYLSDDNRESRTLSTPRVVIVSDAPPEPEKPVIEDFRVLPPQVIQGAYAELIWSVSGETTNIEITSSSMQLSNLDPQGSLRVLGTTTTFFQLTAYNGDLSATKIVDLTVLEPTPTPVPPPPPPDILRFVLRSASGDTGDVNMIRYDANTRTTEYNVMIGTRARMEWDVQSAVPNDVIRVNITDFGAQAPTGQTDNFSVIEAKLYELNASATGGERTAYVRIYLTFTPPPTPRNVNGPPPPLTEGQPITITWQLDLLTPQVIGFRLYRANCQTTSGTHACSEFEVIANETLLTRDPPFVWIDTDTTVPTCGRVYYLTTVYRDLDQQIRETPTSTNWWYGQPCRP